MKLLTKKESLIVKELTVKAVKTIKELGKSLELNDLSLLVNDYSGMVDKNLKLLKLIIKKSFNVKRKLSVELNDLISLGETLKACLESVKKVDSLKDDLLRSLTGFLKDYDVSLLKPKIEYSLNAKSSRSLITLSIEHATAEQLILKVLKANELMIKKTIFKTEDDFVRADVIKSFINELNTNNLKKAAAGSTNKDLLLKVYITLRHQAGRVKELVLKTKDYSEAGTLNELNINYESLKKDILKQSADLKKSLKVYNKSMTFGVKNGLVKKYVVNKLLDKPSRIIRSYLLVNYEVPDMTNQLAYEFLVTNSTINELSIYNEFINRSSFLFMKKLTS